MIETRLQKYLAESGVASRRKAEELIRQGRVTVNGFLVTEMGVKVTETDIVQVDGRKIGIEERKVYLLLNKPIGYVSTAKDQFSRKTVLDLVSVVEERVYPVGRLDYDTSGLLLLTNDGDFTHKMTHPRHEIEKVYFAQVKGNPTREAIQRFERGLKIENYVTSPAKFKVLQEGRNASTVEITIHEGKNRQVRKMCDAIGHPVLSLKRTAIGKLQLGSLPEGQWRELCRKEVEELLSLVSG